MQRPKPVLYIPTMAMIVPCDYKPRSDDVEKRYVMTAAYRLHYEPEQIEGFPVRYVGRLEFRMKIREIESEGNE